GFAVKSSANDAQVGRETGSIVGVGCAGGIVPVQPLAHFLARLEERDALLVHGYMGAGARVAPRSEEHTSELQSPCNLVCRCVLGTSFTELHTLSLHDALPIWVRREIIRKRRAGRPRDGINRRCRLRRRDCPGSAARAFPCPS